MAASDVISKKGQYSLTGAVTYIAQMAAQLRGDNWTEREISPGRYALTCDLNTGFAVREIVNGDFGTYYDGDGAKTKMYSLNTSGNATPAVTFLHSEGVSVMYKVLDVIDNDTIIVDKIRANGTPCVGVVALFTKGTKFNQILANLEATQNISYGTRFADTSATATELIQLTIPVDLDTIGPVHVSGSGTIILT
jgi:hypothetical protein